MLLAALIAACDDGRLPRDATADPDMTQPGMTLRTTVDGWRPAQSFRIGDDELAGPTVLTRVRSVVEDERGAAFVLDEGDRRIIALDSTGGFRYAIGEPGGPSALAAPVSMSLEGDSVLVVLDLGRFALTRFSTRDGEPLTVTPLDRAIGYPRLLGPVADGIVVAGFRPIPGVSSDTLPFIGRIDLRSGEVERLLTLPRDSTVIDVSETHKERNRIVRDPPFAPRPVWAVTPSGTLLYGSGADPVIVEVGRSSQRPLLRTAAPRAAVTAEDRAAYVHATTPPREAGMPPLRSSDVDFPTNKPFYAALRVDPKGRIWLHTGHGAGNQRWEIYDASGSPLGEVRLLTGSRLVGWAGNAVYVVARDDLDVETLIRVRLHDASR